MIGSPDLLAFTSTEGFGGEEDEQEARGLPEELSVPCFPSSHPWSTAAQFHRDFILVAEFSEQVGPSPVLTIPEDSRVLGSFDLNHFSVRIMSVDYQASGPGHTPPSSPGPRLNFSEDSKVILGDSAENAFAYVHHLTLYDLEARGMVRPFCMAYVCSDQVKLMENFSELSTRFSEAAESLKTGNRQAFSIELQRKLQELEYRRLTLRKDAERQTTVNGLTESEGESEELEAVERSVLNHRELLRQVASYPNRKLKQPDFLPYDPATSLTDPLLLPPFEPCFSFSTPSCKSEHHLKPLEELCNEYYLSLTKDRLKDTERRLRGDRSVLRTTYATQSLSRRLTLTNFLFELWSPDDADEEGTEVELLKDTGSKRTGGAFQPEPPSMESFFSCVEEIPIKLEAAEAHTLTPGPGPGTEMTGSVSSSDSIEVLGTEKSYMTQHVADSRDTPVGMTESCSRRAAVDTGIRHLRAYAKRANSEDSIEVLSTTESILTEDLTAITEEEAELQPLSNGFENEEEPQMVDKSYKVLQEEETLNAPAAVGEDENDGPDEEDQCCVESEEPLEQTMVADDIMIKEQPGAIKMNQFRKDNSEEKTSKLLQADEAMRPSPEVHQKVRLMPQDNANFAPGSYMAEVDRWSSPRPPLRLLSVDEESTLSSISFTESSEPPSPIQNIHSNICWDKRRRRKAGLRALRFIKHNSFSQHAVFCLLSGRPLVVIGGDENLVRKTVDALTLFLPAPGPHRSAVKMCLTTPLQLTDLLTWRLMGVHRSSSASFSTILPSLSRYSRYVALLDLDQRTLRCPSYSGSLLSRLANPHTGITRGITYLQHLESCLAALVNHVLVHTFIPLFKNLCVAKEKGNTEEDSWCERGVSECDLRVMSYLSHLIKQRYAGRGPPVLRFAYSSVQMHRNTMTS
ncbi:guanine nucleotide exchange protein smcr8b [Pundamilia nyererei]|uniref:SMCR8-C9orf72 complex subunit n=1 Tax=Pundamilia nyererei TaxID=303518 RepID=A0A3B4GZH5_9CICH|nr:PREDICTED: Smith-Magenis syndrome chromosomal region candidate gene 8 protein [Pundamilia nyererei]